MQEHLALAVVEFDVETATDGKQDHLTGAVSMVATHIAILDVVRPKDASDRERNVTLCLAESQAASLVRDIWKPDNKASFREQS